MNAFISHFTSARRTARSLRRQRGLSLVEIGIVMMVISLVVIGIYGKATSIGDEARIQRAVDDVVLLLTKANSYKADKGSYDEVGIDDLNDDGYRTGSLEDGVGENPWGLDYTLAEDADNDQIVVLTIVTDSDANCTRLSTTLNGLVHNQESVVCETDDDTVTVRAR